MRDSGMGHTSVSWQEIKAWSDMTLAKLDAWEASLIKRLSDEYTYQFNVSCDPTCGPPYQDFSIETIPQAVHESIDQKLRKVFAKLKAKTEQWCYMSNDLSNLVIAVDSTDAAQAATDLDKLTSASQRAETSANKTSGAWNKAIGAIADDTSQIVKELQALNERQMATERRWLEVASATSTAAKSMESVAASLSKVSSANSEAAKSATEVAAANKKASESYDEARARITELAKEAIAAKEAQAQTSAEYMKNAGAVKTYGDAASRAAGQTVGFNSAQDKVSNSSTSAKKALESQDKAVINLLQSIDPLTRKLNDLDRQEEELKKHRDTGRISAEVWADYQSKIDATRTTLTRFDDSLTRTGNTAKQTAAALRGVPAQFTDIIVSLQGGQAPLTVLLQQGGQLKDMFGGVGIAAKALGGYVLGLVNPFTVLAAIVGVLGLAYYKGSEEQDAFSKALITTGNYAGTSTAALADMSKKISGTVGTTGAAAEALAQLAAGGKVASGSFEQIATSALMFQDATGKAVSETIGEFEKIAGDPVRAIGELDDKYHFLTASVYQQIVALKEQGDAQGAAQLAEDAYAKALVERSAQIKQNLGYVEIAWNGIKSAAKYAWDAMLDIGREQTLAEKMKKLKDDLVYIQNAKNNPLSVGDNPDMAVLGRGEEGTKNAISFNELQQEAEKYQNQFLGDIKQRQTQSRQYYDDVQKEIADTANNSDKRNKAILEQEKKIAQARLDGYTITAEQEAKLYQNIRDKYKDPATPKGSNSLDMTVFNDADNQLKALVDSYKNKQAELESAQKAGLVSQEDYSVKRAGLVTEEKDKVTAAYEAEISALESIKSRAKTTGEQRIQLDQKIADARANMTKAQLDADSKLRVLANNETERLAKQKAAVTAYTDALNAQVVALQQQGARNAASVGMGSSQKAIFDQLNAVTDKINSQRLQLATQYGDGSKGMSLEEYQLKLQALENTHNDLTATILTNSDKLKAAQADWTNGAKSAFEEYIDNAENAAAQTKSAFSNTFTALEDVFVKWITTGKASFKDFADTVIAELSRIVVKQQIIAPLLKTVFGSSAVDGSSSATGTSGAGTGSSFGDLLSYGKTAIQLASTSVGSAAIEGFKAGSGLLGSLQGGASGAYNSIIGSVTGNTAAIGASQAGYTSSTISNWAASSGSGAASAGTGAAAGLSGSSAGLYGIGGALLGYQQAGLKGAATGAAGAVGGAYAGAALGTVVPVIGTAIGAALGSVLGGVLGGSVWGGNWVTKNQGIQLAVNDGELNANSFQYQKKKGGLFSSNKKRTKLGALDTETQTQLDEAYDTVEQNVQDLFKTIGIKVNDSVIDGIDVGILQISTKDNTAEEVQQKITDWFATVADAMVGAINTDQMAGLEGYNFESLTTFVNNLVSVDQVLKNLNVGVFDFSVAGGKMAEQLSALSGGLENLTNNAATYYDKFFTDTEKADDVLEAVGKQFAAINVALPATRDGFRAAVESIDITTEAGRTMLATLIGLSGSASQVYDILEQRAKAAEDAALAASQAALQAVEDLKKAVIDTASNSYSKLQRSIAKEQEDLTESFNARMTAMNDMLSTSTKAVSDLTSVGNSLDSALKSIRDTSLATEAILRKQAKATLDSALGQAQAGKSLVDFPGLQDALDVASKMNTDLYSNYNDFAVDRGETENTIDQLNKLNGKQLTSAEETVKNLQDQIKLAQKAYDDQVAAYKKEADYAQSQLDALNGLDTTTTSVLGAIEQMNKDVVAALAALAGNNPNNNTNPNNRILVESAYKSVLGRDGDEAGIQYWVKQLESGIVNYATLAQAIATAAATKPVATAPVADQTKGATYLTDQVNQAYRDVLGRNADSAGLNYWLQQVQSGQLNPEQLKTAIANAGKENGQTVKGYAAGGTTSGGWMTVGEQGPELLKTGPATILSNAQSKKFMQDSGMQNQILLMQVIEKLQKSNDYLYNVTKNTLNAASKLSDIVEDGVKTEAKEV